MKKTIACMIALLSLCAPAYAEEEKPDGIGFIRIQEPKQETPTGETRTIETKEEQESVGMFRVPGHVIPEKPQERPVGEGTEKLASELGKIGKLQKERKIEEAYNKIGELRKQYPEVQTLYSWEAIYAAMAGKYEESLTLWDNFHLTFPMAERGAEEMFYKAFSEMGLKNQEKAAQYIIEGTKTKDAFSGTVKSQRIIKTAFIFLAIKGNTDRTAKDVSALWDTLSIDEKNNLDNFYGFDLSELWLWQGDLLGQNKWLKKYIETERENEAEEAVRNSRAAARLLYTREERP